jgi:hypothetical protein
MSSPSGTAPRPHPEPPAGEQFDYFVGIGQASTKEMGVERDTGSFGKRGLSLPLDTPDIRKPRGHVVRVRRVLPHFGKRSLNEDVS